MDMSAKLKRLIGTVLLVMAVMVYGPDLLKIWWGSLAGWVQFLVGAVFIVGMVALIAIPTRHAVRRLRR
jgi:hypothetical protein